jgi:endothelin-converting enzyme/putative endopeptidase
MAPAVPPCDDFFEYACGGWLKNNPIPEDQSSWGRFNQLAEQNEIAQRAIVEADEKPGAKGPYARALGDLYASWMDEDAIEKEGVRPLAAHLAEMDKIKDARSFAKAMASLTLAGVSAFFDIDPEQDPKDATRMIVEIDQSCLGMPDRDYYLRDDERLAHVREAYQAHVARSFELAGDSPAQAKDESAAVLSLEKDLAAAQIPRTEHHDPSKTYHKVDRAGLARMAPAFDWDTYFKEVGRPDVKTIHVDVPSFVTAAFASLSGPPGAWLPRVQSYLRWRYVRRYERVLTRKLVDESFAFEKELSGARVIAPRWKRCVREVDVAMGEALAIPFVEAKLGDDGKAATTAIVREIEAAMEEDLEGLPWMDEATRARAETKVHKLVNKVGYPDRWRSYDALAPKIKRTAYASNVLEARRFEAIRELALVGKPVGRAEWRMTPPTADAYYNPQLNEMVFPAGILQAPFYAKEAPPAVSFGGVGFFAGHELTHGFDDKGRKYDGDGTLTDGWSADVGTTFDRRAACVAEQYDGYVAIDDLHLNGKLTLGENLADLGGTKLALAALHHRQPPSPEADRQFFLGFAQVWFAAVRPEAVRVRVLTDPHSPAKLRVNGPLSNTPAFAAAFSCRAGDPMVRPDPQRCNVW